MYYFINWESYDLLQTLFVFRKAQKSSNKFWIKMSCDEMSYDESLVYKELMENSRILAQQILTNIRRLGHNFTLDGLTLGDGNCFFRAILQQCRRPEVYSTLPDEVKVFVDKMDHYGFRKWVKKCVFDSDHVKVQEETLQPFLPKPWKQYWSDNYMMKNGFWVDDPMVRCTAWFLKMDFMIISDDNEDYQCVTMIPGNIDDEKIPTEQKLFLGFKAESHYQSILPIEVPNDCPCCRKTFKNILNHVNQIKACKNFVGEELLGIWRQINDDKSKKKMRMNYDDSGKHKLYQDDYVLSGKHKLIQRSHIAKKREEDPDQLKANQRKWYKTWRKSSDEDSRHRNFLEESKYGPIFICICCHRKLSKGNVTVFNDKVEKQIKVPMEDCIFDMDLFTNIIEFRNGKEVSPNNR